MYCTASAPTLHSLPLSPWWQHLHPDGNACLRLWLFPCIGTGAAAWHPWARPLSGAAELVAVCLPGREARLFQAPFTRLNKLADTFADEVAPWLDERDVFCGHGMGGLLAFEVARRLRRRGVASPRGLVLCGAHLPHRGSSEQPLHRLSPRQFLAAVEERYGTVPAELRSCPEMIELLLPTFRADLEMVETYTQTDQDRLDIPILALVGASEPVVSCRPAWEWQRYTSVSFEWDRVTGGHFIAIENPSDTAARVRDFLARF